MSDFTAEQLEAIERRQGPFALAAGAGSGKTSVLVERYVRAVVADGVAPSRILAITFTDRAAGELRERVRRRLIDLGAREAARESAAAFVSTFHGFCARLLRTNAVLAGLGSDFSVLSEAAAAALRDAAFARALDGWLGRPGALDLAAAFEVPALAELVGATYDELRSRGERAPLLPTALPRHDIASARAALAGAAAALGAGGDDVPEVVGDCARLVAGDAVPSPAAVAALALPRRAADAAYEAARARFEEACADALGVPAVALLGGLLEEFGAAYADAKRTRGAVDFDDLELEAVALLAAHDEVRVAWAERFELIMVDELQDTNARQIALLAALDREDLFTVGDEHQSIYGFRHAEVALFRERFERLEIAGAVGALRTNFRSVAPLLAATGAIFASRFGGRFAPLRAGRHVGPDGEPVLELLLSDRDSWEEHEERLGVELAPAPLWRRAEARLLARRIDELIVTGLAGPEDIVVLMRAGTSIGTYESALSDLGHTTLATAGGGFFGRPEVIDLVAYLRILANPLDELALYSVLASPLGGCGPDALASLARRAHEHDRSPWEALMRDPPDGASRDVAARVISARERAAHEPLAATVAAALAESGYERHLASLHSPERRIANVRKLEELARDWERREGRDLRAFAAALAAGRASAARETEAPPPAAGTGAIRLMSIHAAKGLEFPVVAVADLAHAPSGGEAALLVDGERVGLRLPTEDRRRIDTLGYEALRAERRRAAAAEEERVIYVAMTRARDRLILSGAARFASWPSPGSAPIAWLGPALIDDLSTRAARGDGAVHTVQGAGGVPIRLTLLTSSNINDVLGTPSPPVERQRELPREPGLGEQLALPIDEHPPLVRAPPVRAAPAPLALSYSAVADYERCGYRYYLQRVLGLPDEAAGLAGEEAAARGSVVHALLEELDFAHPTIERSAVAAAALRAGIELEDPEEAAALAGAFARSPLCARLAAAGEVRREQPFAFLLGERLVRGFLDVAGVERDGTMLIVDYKSDRVADGEDLALRVERDYALQRSIYALAALSAGASAVEVAHCFLRRPEEVLSARVQASGREHLAAELAVRVAPLAAGRFDVSPEPGLERCAGCPGRARLCSHDEAMTAREPLVGA